MLCQDVSVLIVKPIGPGVTRYFLDGRHPGRWAPGATHLLGLHGDVRGEDLSSVLRGEDPLGGGFLPARRPAPRRAGWDLVFCAPKSLSLVGATDPALAEPVAAAHVAAVDDVLAHVESHLRVHRRQESGERAQAEGLVAAAFDHLRSAASEPHLHTHVLVANLSRSGGRWGGVSSEEWYPGRRALAGLYHLGLRHHLAARGVEVDWRLRSDGLADLVGVPRQAVRATSTQANLVAGIGRFEARRRAVATPWEERARSAGLRTLAGTPRAPSNGRVPADASLARAVATRLATQRSDFRRADVVVALAASWPGGAPPAEVSRWVDSFLEASEEVPSPTAGRRWTTELARRSDAELVRELESVGVLAVLTAPPGQSRLLAQAEVVDELRAGSGRAVALSSPTAAGELRWAIQAGIAPYRPGSAVDLIVVDQADRRPAVELTRLARAARRSGAGLLFVEGGTMPRLSNPASRGWAGTHPDPWPCPAHEVWTASAVGAGRLTGRPAAAHVLSEWLAAWQSGRPVVLSALGLEEVRGLNRAARLLLGRRGTSLDAGERVVLLRARHDGVRHGAFGTVVEPPGKNGVTILWDGERSPSAHRRDILPRLGPGYAASVRLAAGAGAAVALLGPERAAPQLRGRLLATVEERAPGLERPRSLSRS